jgi:hypothetical protein
MTFREDSGYWRVQSTSLLGLLLFGAPRRLAGPHVMRDFGYHICGIGTLLLSVTGKILHLVMCPNRDNAMIDLGSLGSPQGGERNQA